jgi:hypothetical protein
MMMEPQLVETAVATARTMLVMDGYDVELAGCEDGVLSLKVIAGPDACADCLVPKDMLAGLIQAKLPSETAFSRIDLIYPADSP